MRALVWRHRSPHVFVARTTLETAERTLHGMSAAAFETVDLAENEVHQIAENLTENKQTTRPNGRGRTTSR